jgi:hypothetical protein
MHNRLQGIRADCCRCGDAPCGRRADRFALVIVSAMGFAPSLWGYVTQS